MPHRHLFRHTLRQALEKRFGKHHITAQEFANAYNLVTEEAISTETARKWLSGLGLPRYQKIFELVHWLRIDPRELFNYAPEQYAEKSRLQEQYQRAIEGQFTLTDIEQLLAEELTRGQSKT